MNENNEIVRFITFKLADNFFCIRILDIREIAACAKLTSVQKAPPVVKGLVNLRGQILTALNINVLLNLDITPVRPDSHMIVFKHHNIGFIVDQIGDMISIDHKQIDPVPANIDPNIKVYLECMIRLEDRLIMAISTQKILAHRTDNEEAK